MLRGFMQNHAGPKNMCKKARKTSAGQISRGVIQGLAWCPGESPVSPLPLSKSPMHQLRMRPFNPFWG